MRVYLCGRMCVSVCVCGVRGVGVWMPQNAFVYIKNISLSIRECYHYVAYQAKRPHSVWTAIYGLKFCWPYSMRNIGQKTSQMLDLTPYDK